MSGEAKEHVSEGSAAAAEGTAAESHAAEYEDFTLHRSDDMPQPLSGAAESSLSPAALRARQQRHTTASSPDHHARQTLWRVVFSHTIAWDTRLRRANIALAILGLLNFAVVLVLYESCWDRRTLRFALDAEDCSTYAPLQHVGEFLYVAFILQLCYYYYEKSGFKALVGHYPSRRGAFFYSGLLYGFLYELAASIVQPFPLLHFIVDLRHAQYLIILSLVCKLYLLVRVLRDGSAVYQKRMFLKHSNQRFDTSYYQMDYLTIAKTYAYHYTTWVLVIGCALNGAFMAYLLHLCERELWLPRDAHSGALPRRWDDLASPALLGGIEHEHTSGGFRGGSELLLEDSSDGTTYFQSPYVSLLNCAYFVGIVATTTGLGDIAPVTPQGKIFAVMSALMGIAWSSFVVGVLTNKLVPSDFQAYCIDFLQRSKIQREKERLAATIIQRAWRLHREWVRMESRGQSAPHGSDRCIAVTEELGSIIRHFQSAQHREANTSYMIKQTAFAAEGIKLAAAVGGSTAAQIGSPLRQRLSGGSPSDRMRSPPSTATTKGNAAVARQSASSNDTSPLLRQKQTSYGSSGGGGGGGGGGSGDKRGSLSRSGSLSVATERPGVNRSRSASVAGGPSRSPEMSAERALRALHYLNRPGSRSRGDSDSDPAALVPAAGGSVGVAGGSGGSPRGFQGYTATAQALSTLSSQNLALASSIRGLESKLDQLLTASSRAGVHENMLEGGHCFISWSSNGAKGVAEDAVATPMLLWLDRDDQTKYGSLHWTTEEFAVHARLRIKQPGNSFPLHSITDVLLGKEKSPEFNLPSTASLNPALCFAVLSKAHPGGLKLQAHYAEERTLWISQLKQAFLPQRGKLTPSGGSSTTTSPKSGPVAGASTSAHPASAAGGASPAAPHRTLGTGSSASSLAAQGARRASESMASHHARAQSSMPSYSATLSAHSEVPSPTTPSIGGRFKPEVPTTTQQQQQAQRSAPPASSRTPPPMQEGKPSA